MELSSQPQKFHFSLTAITWIGFVVVCAIFGGYVSLLRNKELTDQSILRSELQALREENRQLIDRSRELEQQITSMREERSTLEERTSDATQTQEGSSEVEEIISGTEAVEKEIEEAKQRSFVYTVKKGDTPWDIANMYNIEVKDLLRWNNLTRRSRLFPGDQLTIILEE